ncbi:MAG: Ig-like domain repeat protein [Terracidiphilus sp.]
MLPRFALLKSSLFVLGLITLLLPASMRAQTITAGGPINFTASDSLPQSSTVTVSNAPGPVKTVVVTLHGVTSNGTGDYQSMGYAEFLLVSPSPNSAQFVLLGATGDGLDSGGLSGVNITIQDGAAAAPEGNPWSDSSQTVAPSSYFNDNYAMPPPLPVTENTSDYPQTDGINTLNGQFSGVTADGTWTLFLFDSNGDPVSITGWTMALTYSAATPTTTVLSSASNPAFYANNASAASITYTATVTSGSGTPTGTVTFQANGANECSNVAVSSGTAHCTMTLAQGNYGISAQYTPSGVYGQSSSSLEQLVEVTPANPSGDQWCNNRVISDPALNNPGLAYPSIIGINHSSYNGKTVGNVTVELEGLQGSSGIDGQYLLVAPGGTKSLVFLQYGWFNDSGPVSAVDLTFDDTASQSVPFNSGSPTTPPYGTDNVNYTHTGILTFGEAFDGASANGKWALYSLSPSATTMNSGWCITLSLNSGLATTTALTSGGNPATTGNPVKFTASVTDANGPVSGGTVTFLDNGEAPAGASGGSNIVALTGGAATFTTSSLTEGDHAITANYSGVTNVDNESFSATLHQRINTATTVTSESSSSWSYCNPGEVQIQDGSLAGPLTPNPSVISVANLPGTLNTVSITLNGFSVLAANGLQELASLVEGPSGAALDFFSNTTQGANGNGQASPPGAYTFQDSVGGLVPSGNTSITPGPYKPTAYLNYLSTPDVFTSSLSGFYNVPSFSYAAPHGSSTFADIFTDGSNANGTWSLFFSSGVANGTFGAANGWCVNLHENLPSLAQPVLAHAGAFTPGELNAAYTVNITNNGPGATGDPTGTNKLTVTDLLNSAFTYSTFSGTGWSCSATGQTVNCTNDTPVADGGSYPMLTIDVDVAAGASGSINNSVLVSGGGVTTISSNTDSVTIQTPPVLSVTKSHTGSKFVQGGDAVWNITVNNTATGGTTSATVYVSDPLPSGYTVFSFGTTSASWSCSGTTTVACSSTQAVSGGSSFPQIQVIAVVPSNAPTPVTNTVVVYGGGDLSHTNATNGATASDTVTVDRVPASITVLGGGTQSATVSTAFGNALSVLVEDAGGNPVQGATVTFTAPASGASGTFSTGNNIITVQTNGSGVAGSTTFTANSTPGSYSVTAQAGGLGTQVSFSLTNNPGAATHLVIPGGPEPFYTAFGFNIYAYDAVGNLATSYNGTVALTSSDPGFVNLGPVTLVNGVGSQSTVLKTAGIDTITATDIANSSIKGTGSFTIPPGAATYLGLSAPPSAIAGSPINFTVTAYDLYFNVAAGYGGTVAFTSSDPNAILPGSSAITNGTGTFSATMETAGTQTIAATDAANSLAASSGNISVTIPALVITTANDDAGTAGNCTVQTTPGTGTDASCSLRDALLKAAALGSGSISFNASTFTSAQSITLTNGTLNIPSNTSITGPTHGSGATLANLVTVNGGGSSSDFSVFTVSSGVTGAAIANLTIANGHTTNVGGGIDNLGTLAVTGSTVSGNSAARGGGIYNSGTLTATGSTVSGNSAGQNAGGIYNFDGTLTVTGSTVSGNSAGQNIGGIYNFSGTLTLTGSTVSGNSAGQVIGGIANSSGTLTASNSIVAGNAASSGYADWYRLSDTYNDDGGNLVGAGAGGTSTINPMLAPLANYGGSTQTMLPLPGSPAICTGLASNDTVNHITTDQRGFGFSSSYCSSGHVDAGAVQTNYALSFTTDPGASQVAGVPFTAGVTLTESGSPMSGVTIPLTLNGGGALSGGSANTNSSGVASYTLTVANLTALSGLALTATLPSPPTLKSNSTSFNLSAPPPTVTGISPSSGFTTGGTAVTINGTNFTGATAVDFGSTQATNVIVVNTTTITATTPAGVGTVNVSVTTSGGTSAASPADQFTYVVPAATSLTPAVTPGSTFVYSQQPSISVALAPSNAAGITVSDFTATLDSSTVLTVTAGTGNNFNIALPATPLTVGAHTIAVNFAGATGYAASSTTISLTVTTPSLVVTTLLDQTDSPAYCTSGTGTTCSLRDAITAANLGGAGHITFTSGLVSVASPGTITLGTGTAGDIGLPAITGNVTITGPGANQLTISGNNDANVGTVLTINPGATVTIYGLTIASGNMPINPGGGGIYNLGTLTVMASAITGNQATNGFLGTGSGIYQGGGGILSSGALTVTNSTVSGNTAVDVGGGISSGGTLKLTESTVSGNTAAGDTSGFGAWGGGLAFAGALTLTNSTVSGNTANCYGSPCAYPPKGGGIYTTSGTLTAANSIVAGNTTQGVLGGDDCDGCGTLGSSNLVGGTPQLSALQYNGIGVTLQTMIPLPGSPAICAGRASNIPSGVTTDERGYPLQPSGGYCSSTNVDSGAVQTRYALAFTINPPASPATVLAGQAITPAPAVSLTENGNPVTAATNSITMADSASLLTGTASANLAAGTATFNNLILPAATASDKLTATLTLHASLNLTAQSTAFQAIDPSAATLITPAPGSTLSGASVTFTWTAGTNVKEYWLYIGTSGRGTTDLYNSAVATNSAHVTNLPIYGQTVYVRLLSKINGLWQYNDYTYTAVDSSAPAAMLTPASGSTLSGSAVTFTWTAGADVNEYWLYIGTTGHGTTDLYNSGVTTTSAHVTNLPTFGQPVYVRLLSKIKGVWRYNDYTYTAENVSAPAAMLTPASGSTFTGANATFTWTTGTNVSGYWLYAGSTGPGSTNIYNSPVLTTTANVTKLPIYGQTVYVRLLSKINGAWQYKDYTYTAQNTSAPATMLTPASGSTLSGSSATFTWTAGANVTVYWLYIGTKGPGSTDLYNASTFTTSASVAKLPVNGAKVYVRLLSKINGAWQYNDYTYTAK